MIKSWRKFSHSKQPLKGKILLDRNFFNLRWRWILTSSSTPQHNHISTEELALGSPVCRKGALLCFTFPVSLMCIHINSTSPSPLLEHWKFSATSITHSTHTPREVSCKIKLSYQKSSQLPTVVTRVSEPVLLTLFPFCLSEEPYSEQSTFHLTQIHPHWKLKCAQYPTEIQEQYERNHCGFVHLSL